MVGVETSNHVKKDEPNMHHIDDIMSTVWTQKPIIS